MNLISLKKLATNYMHIWDADCQDLLDLYADDSITVQYTHFKEINGLSAYKNFLKSTYQTFPDIKITLGEVLVNKKDGNVTIFWKYTGTHQQNTLFGVEPSGKEISVNGMTVLKLKKGKVISEKGIIDNLSLLMQLNTKQ